MCSLSWTETSHLFLFSFINASQCLIVAICFILKETVLQDELKGVLGGPDLTFLSGRLSLHTSP